MFLKRKIISLVSYFILALLLFAVVIVSACGNGNIKFSADTKVTLEDTDGTAANSSEKVSETEKPRENGGDLSSQKEENEKKEGDLILENTANDNADTGNQENANSSQGTSDEPDDIAALANEAPQVSLKIVSGPHYAQNNQVCYYRVRAVATGKPYPALEFNRDDSNGSWGKDLVQVNLTEGETFMLTCSASNESGTANTSLELKWVGAENPGQEENGTGTAGHGTLASQTLIDDSQIDFSNAANFRIEVNLLQQRVYIYYMQNPAKILICSAGKEETPTPVGDFTTSQKIYYSYVPRFAQAAYYWTRFYGAYLFHSVPYDIDGNLLVEELEKMGTPASHGCVRLYLEDARWIYEKLPLGINVNIHY